MEEEEPVFVFAMLGDSFQQVGGKCPGGWIVMVGPRPGVGFVAQADGTWAEPPSLVPASCTRRQGLLALLAFGFKRADIEAQIAAINDETEREEAQIEYEANVWERANPRLQQMWAALGGAPAQLDDLYRLAVTL